LEGTDDSPEKYIGSSKALMREGIEKQRNKRKRRPKCNMIDGSEVLRLQKFFERQIFETIFERKEGKGLVDGKNETFYT